MAAAPIITTPRRATSNMVMEASHRDATAPAMGQIAQLLQPQ